MALFVSTLHSRCTAGEEMASIVKRLQKDGEVYYTAFVRRRGFPARYQSFARKTDAERWARNLETELDQGIVRSRDQEKHTLAELIDRFLAGPFLEVSANQQPQLRARVLWWREVLGEYLLQNIRARDLSECKQRLLAEPVRQGRKKGAIRRRGKATVNRYLSALSVVFRWARTELHLEIANPVRDVARMKEERTRDRVLSLEEQRVWLAVCREDANPLLYPFCALLCATGARVGELEQLTWKNVDLTPGREHIVIRVGSSVRNTTKNKVLRAVPIGWQAIAVEAMLELRKVDRTGQSFVFPNRTHTGPAGLRNAFMRSIGAAGLGTVTPHTLRHTVATQLAEIGFTTHQLMAFFGWKTSAMADRYIHAQPQRMLKQLPMHLTESLSL